MKSDSLEKRYDGFVIEAQNLLQQAGFAEEDQTPVITGKAFYEACVALAKIHFPEDRDVGTGPKGLLWGMYDAVKPSHVGGKDPDPVSGAKSIATILKGIIKNRPPLDIEKPHIAQTATAINTKPKVRRSPNTREVFVVHGHDGEAKQTVARFCEHLEVKPVVLHEKPDQGRTIIEKFEDHADVDFAIVIMTSDDTGYPRGRPDKAKNRARQNVLFEWGYFVGRIGRNRVCALYEEGVEIPSDYQGVLYIPMDKAGSWKTSLARELKAAGVPINLSALVK